MCWEKDKETVSMNSTNNWEIESRSGKYCFPHRMGSAKN